MGRAPCCDKANVKKGPWSPEEDAKLKSYIEKHGTGGNWIALPQKIGLRRCGKSCRLRWLNYLRPNIKHGGFTEDEDNLICSLYVSIGSRWSIIAAQLPGRTDNDIKNYWNTKLKKKLLGKQRREQQTRRQLGTIHEKRYDQSYSNSLYTRPQQPVKPPLPPLLVRYASEENRLHKPASNSLITNISIMPQINEANFSYDHTQLNNQGKIFEAFNCISDVSSAQNQHLCKNSTYMSFVNCLRPSLESDIHINLPAFDGIPEAGMYASMPQLLDGPDGFSTINDVVNSSTTITSSSSLETESWRDTNSVVYPQSALTNYEVSNQEMPQYWTLFDEPRLLSYS